MITDPSWLYSTIAQASAAIVAIIGGFITASLLMLTAEKRNIVHQKADKETRIKALRQEEKRLYKLYRAMEVDHFLKSIEDELKKEEELPSFDKFVKRYPLASYLDPIVLKQEYKKLTKLRIEARKFMEQHSDIIDVSDFVSFDDWVQRNELDIPLDAYGIYQDEYYSFRTYEQQIKTEEQKKDIWPWLGSTPLLHSIPSLREAQYDLYFRDREDRRLEDVKRRINGLRQEILLLESEVANLDTRLRAFGDPPNLRRGLLVLGYLAVFGILLPVLIIAKSKFSLLAENIVTLAFSIGIIGVFAYIVLQIRALRRK